MSRRDDIHSAGLRRWSLLLVIPAIALSVVGLAWLSHWNLVAASRDRTVNALEAIALQFERQFDSQARTLLSNLELFARSATLAKYLRTTDEFERYETLQGPLLEQFTSYEAAYPDYYEFRVLLLDGYEDTRYTSRSIRNHTEEEADWAFFKRLAATDSRAPAVVATLRNPDDGAWALYGGRGVYLRDLAVDPVLAGPTRRGFVVVTSDFSVLQRQVDETRLGESGFVFVTDRTGTPVLQQAGRGGLIDPSMASSLTAIARARKAETVNWGAQEFLITGRPMGPDLQVFAAIPAAEQAAESRRLLGLVTLVAVPLVAVPGFLVTFLINRTLVRPIEKLRDAAARVRRGDFDVEIRMKGNRQISDLAVAFTDMSKGLKAQREALAEKQ
ncbi:MAG: HAMP domain-containing protein, partial [Gammaproteobacteria bacterium]